MNQKRALVLMTLAFATVIALAVGTVYFQYAYAMFNVTESCLDTIDKLGMAGNVTHNEISQIMDSCK
jgi:hypothetical protein